MSWTLSLAPNLVYLLLFLLSIFAFGHFLSLRKEIKKKRIISQEKESLLLGARIEWFGWIAQAATLLGLLGTVLGIYLSFSEMEAVGKASVEVLAGGIRTALGTTIFGLLVAIPSLTFRQICDSWMAQREAELMEVNGKEAS